MDKKRSSLSTKTLVLCAILTALVVILQLYASSIRFGMFSISLVLVPIVIGAAVAGPLAGAYLGLVFGFTVLLSGDAAPFLSVNAFGTIITVLAKVFLAGLISGLTFFLISKKNKLAAVFSSAAICPIVNTGIFLLGCVLFFMPTIREWAVAAGFESAGAYMFLVLAGINFLVELLTNLILAPIILRLLNVRKY